MCIYVCVQYAQSDGTSSLDWTIVTEQQGCHKKYQ